jgi:hypothetical protein
VPVKSRRPPSLHLICEVLPDHSSFSVLRETPMAFSCNYFKKLNCHYLLLTAGSFNGTAASLRDLHLHMDGIRIQAIERLKIFASL